MTEPTKSEKKSKSKSGRRVYVLADSQLVNGVETPVLRPVEVKNGITDGSSTEMLEGLKEGDEVVTGISKEKDRAKRSFNPFAWNR